MKKLLVLMLSCIVFIPQAARAMNLRDAARDGNVARVTELLNISGTDINQPDEGGMTPLHRAVIGNHEAIVSLLLEHGVAVDPQSYKFGDTPLFFAALYGLEAIVRLLLEYGADVNKTNRDGRTPLQVVPRGSGAIVRLLQGWPAELARRAEAKQKAGLAISTGLHPRAGAASPVRHINPATVQKIMGYVRPADYAIPEPEVPSETEEGLQ